MSKYILGIVLGVFLLAFLIIVSVGVGRMIEDTAGWVDEHGVKTIAERVWNGKGRIDD